MREITMQELIDFAENSTQTEYDLTHGHLWLGNQCYASLVGTKVADTAVDIEGNISPCHDGMRCLGELKGELPNSYSVFVQEYIRNGPEVIDDNTGESRRPPMPVGEILEFLTAALHHQASWSR